MNMDSLHFTNICPYYPVGLNRLVSNNVYFRDSSYYKLSSWVYHQKITLWRDPILLIGREEEKVDAADMEGNAGSKVQEDWWRLVQEGWVVFAGIVAAVVERNFRGTQYRRYCS